MFSSAKQSSIFSTRESKTNPKNNGYGLALFGNNISDIKYQYKNTGLTGVRAIFDKDVINKSDLESIQAYNKEIDNCTTSQTAFNRTMLDSSTNAQKIVAAANGEKVAIDSLKVAEENATGASKLLKAGQVALNAVLTTFATIAITKGLEKLANYYDDISDKANDAVQTYQEQTDKLKEFGATQEETASRYAELAKGVDAFGNNVSLTADEYKEFNEISNEIAELFPSLVQGYNDEGNAILSCKNK